MVSDKIGEIVLYVIRHAEVAEDKEGTIRGLLNPKLDAKGRRDADSLVDFFRGIPLSFVVVDDLKRTQQTAAPLADSKDLEPVIDIDLRSWDVGPELEGKDIEQNKEKIARLKTHSQLVPTGGQSWGSYCRQADAGFHRYVDRALESLDAGAIVVHGSFIQVTAEMLGFTEGDTAYDHTPIEPAGVIAVYMTRQGLRMKILKGAKDTTDE